MFLNSRRFYNIMVTMTKKARTDGNKGKALIVKAASPTGRRSLIDEKEFLALRREISEYDAARDIIIRESRDVTKLSKSAIYSLHRGETAAAKQQLAQAEKVIAKLLKDVERDAHLRDGSFSASLEEYTEAKAFLRFLEDGTLITQKELAVVEGEEYLLGLCDFTGELVRYAVLRATARDKRAVQRCRDIIDAIHGQFLQFDLRNSELRRKYDSIKYNLQKAENVLYDLTLNPRDAGNAKNDTE
jgi:predicted translin family RNA/ssDNA-binding protein